jgi:hypothetical protein
MCNAGFNLARRVMAVDGWRLVQVACRAVVCQNFADELSFTFTVRWRGGKARIFRHALTSPWRPTNFCACVRLLGWAPTFVSTMNLQLVNVHSASRMLVSKIHQLTINHLVRGTI